MKVTVYSTTTCPYCVMLKKWLKEKNVDFSEYLVDQNPYAAQMMVSMSGQMGVPFSTVEQDDGSVDKILGFDREKFAISLSKQHLKKAT